MYPKVLWIEVAFSNQARAITIAKAVEYEKIVLGFLAKVGIAGTFRVVIGGDLDYRLAKGAQMAVGSSPAERETHIGLALLAKDSQAPVAAWLYVPKELSAPSYYKLLVVALAAEAAPATTQVMSLLQIGEFDTSVRSNPSVPKTLGPVDYTREVFQRSLENSLFGIGTLARLSLKEKQTDEATFKKNTKEGVCAADLAQGVRDSFWWAVLTPAPEIRKEIERHAHPGKKQGEKKVNGFLRKVLGDEFCIAAFEKAGWVRKVGSRYFFTSKVIPPDTKMFAGSLDNYLDWCFELADVRLKGKEHGAKLAGLEERIVDVRAEIERLGVELARLEAEHAEVVSFAQVDCESIARRIEELEHKAFAASCRGMMRSS
ncbi:MAG: hypothetical protein V4674_02875 [Patescibacteria group bacterium]